MFTEKQRLDNHENLYTLNFGPLPASGVINELLKLSAQTISDQKAPSLGNCVLTSQSKARGPNIAMYNFFQ